MKAQIGTFGPSATPTRPPTRQLSTTTKSGGDARQAAVQSGDRSLIPVLQSAAERVTDAREKAALLEAADFLALPTMSEAQAGE